MATPIATAAITNPSLLAIPSHLWIGPQSAVHAYFVTFFQKQFCAQSGCTKCATCIAIAQKQHYAIQWICPDKNYTREQLDPLFEQLSFALSNNEKFFFVLEQIDFMSVACANSLLKSLEEPPPGYYFFLSAQREYAILPTIRSRCMHHAIVASHTDIIAHPLFDYFATTTFYDPTTFLADLEKSEINEQESIALLDTLLAHWMTAAKRALQANKKDVHQRAMTIVALIAAAFEKPPMPGSSKIFWKDIYLQMKCQIMTKK